MKRTEVWVAKPKGRAYWQVYWWEIGADGKRHQRKQSSGSVLKRDALGLRDQIREQLKLGTVPNEEMPWTTFLKEFLDKEVKPKPPRTRQSYTYCLANFTRLAEPKRLGDVTKAKLEDFRNGRLEEAVKRAKRRGEKLSPATVNRDLRHIRRALNWAVERGYLAKVPSFRKVMLREDKKDPTIIPLADFSAMVKAVERADLVLGRDWWRTFVYVGYYCGLRTGELLSLQWPDVNNDTVRVRAWGSKSRKDRVIPITAELKDVLDAFKPGVISVTREVFPYPYGDWKKLYRDWHAIQDTAGFHEHFVPKDGRSSFCSDLAALGVSTATVKDLAGHSSMATTERYYINAKPAHRAAIEKRKVSKLA